MGQLTSFQIYIFLSFKLKLLPFLMYYSTDWNLFPTQVHINYDQMRIQLH